MQMVFDFFWGKTGPKKLVCEPSPLNPIKHCWDYLKRRILQTSNNEEELRTKCGSKCLSFFRDLFVDDVKQFGLHVTGMHTLQKRAIFHPQVVNFQ